MTIIAVDRPEGAGAITWWEMAGDIDRAALGVAWAAVGLDMERLPNSTTPAVALSRAVGDIYHSPTGNDRQLARPLPGGAAWEVVAEEVLAASDGEPAQLDHRPLMRAWLTGAPRRDQLACDEPNPTGLGWRPIVPSETLTATYERHRDCLAASDLGTWLVARVGDVHGVSLRRRSGGFYFVPEPDVATWRQMVEAVHAGAKACRIYTIPAMGADEAIAAVLDALTADVGGFLTDTETELDLGDLGVRALAHRRERCEAVLGKLDAYSGLLGPRIDQLRTQVGALEANIAELALLAETPA